MIQIFYQNCLGLLLYLLNSQTIAQKNETHIETHTHIYMKKCCLTLTVFEINSIACVLRFSLSFV